jgi:hypothetical protein
MTDDTMNVDLEQMYKSLLAQLEERVSEDVAEESDWYAITCALAKAACRGFTLGAEAARIAYRDKMREIEIPLAEIVGDGAVERDLWLERYGLEHYGDDDA